MFLGNAGAQHSGDNITLKELVREKHSSLYMITYLTNGKKLIPLIPVLFLVELDTYGAPVFAPNYSATILSAKLCTNSNEHFMHIRFL
jgi:hypothetical protein